MSEEKVSVSFLPVYTTRKNVSYYLQGREVDKSTHPRTDLFQPGNYPQYNSKTKCGGDRISPIVEKNVSLISV